MAKIVAAKNGTKKEVIAKTAAKLFLQKGFSATSMRDIAVEIGVEAPSLYNHISSKTELLQEICFRIAHLFNGHILGVESSTESFQIKLKNLISFHIKMMVSDYESVYISDHEWKHLPEPYLSDFKNQRKSYRAKFTALIAHGIKTNEFRKIDPAIAVLTILSAISGVESWKRYRSNIDAAELEKNMVNILLEGINKKISLT
jgi:AcrR family transcriptional regulator